MKCVCGFYGPTQALNDHINAERQPLPSVGGFSDRASFIDALDEYQSSRQNHRIVFEHKTRVVKQPTQPVNATR